MFSATFGAARGMEWNRHSTLQFACLLCLCPVSSPGIMRLSKRNCNVAKVINSTITHCHKFHQPVRTDLWGMIVFASAARCSYSLHPSIGSGLQWRCALWYTAVMSMQKCSKSYHFGKLASDTQGCSKMESGNGALCCKWCCGVYNLSWHSSQRRANEPYSVRACSILINRYFVSGR